MDAAHADTTEENEREKGKDTGAAVPASGYVILWENQASLLRTEELFQPVSVVSAIYPAQRAVIRAKVSTGMCWK